MRTHLAAIAILLALVAGCASNPSPQPSSSARGDQTLGLFARLVKRNGQYTVSGICRLRSLGLAADVSQYPECPASINKNGSLYFNLTTLAPTAASDEICLAWGEKEGEKQPPACEEFRDLHSTDVSTNILTAPFNLIASAQTAGTRMGTAVELDENAFRAAIEVALPTPQRLAMLDEERAWRQAAPGRAQAAAQQRLVQQESARIQRQTQVQNFRAQIQQVNRAAELRFQEAAAAPKAVGATVCSADNRLAFVEQISGTRIRLQVYGVAFARWTDALLNSNPLGPFSVDTSRVKSILPSDPENEGLELPVTDRLYLFKPHTAVLIRPYTGTANVLWDESRFWGACGWRA